MPSYTSTFLRTLATGETIPVFPGGIEVQVTAPPLSAFEGSSTSQAVKFTKAEAPTIPLGGVRGYRNSFNNAEVGKGVRLEVTNSLHQPTAGGVTVTYINDGDATTVDITSIKGDISMGAATSGRVIMTAYGNSVQVNPDGAKANEKVVAVGDNLSCFMQLGPATAGALGGNPQTLIPFARNIHFVWADVTATWSGGTVYSDFINAAIPVQYPNRLNNGSGALNGPTTYKNMTPLAWGFVQMSQANLGSTFTRHYDCQVDSPAQGYINVRGHLQTDAPGSGFQPPAGLQTPVRAWAIVALS